MGSIAKNLRIGKPSFGLVVETPEQVDLLAHLGMDFAVMLMHMSRLDWSEVAHIITGCQKWGITSLPFIPANPWVGKYDPRLAVDVHKALSMGAGGAIVSVHGAREVEELIATAKEHSWHHSDDFRIYETAPGQEQEAVLTSLRDEVLVVPCIESTRAWQELEAIMAVPGLKMVFIGMTDLSRSMGLMRDYDHPKLWEALDRVIALGNSKGVAVMESLHVMQIKDDTFEKAANRAVRLVQHGCKVVMLHKSIFWMHVALAKCLGEIKKGLP